MGTFENWKRLADVADMMDLFGFRRARFHRYIRFTFVYMYQSRYLLYRAHQLVSILSLHHHRFFVLISGSHVVPSCGSVEPSSQGCT